VYPIGDSRSSWPGKVPYLTNVVIMRMNLHALARRNSTEAFCIDDSEGWRQVPLNLNGNSTPVSLAIQKVSCLNQKGGV